MYLCSFTTTVVLLCIYYLYFSFNFVFQRINIKYEESQEHMMSPIKEKKKLRCLRTALQILLACHCFLKVHTALYATHAYVNKEFQTRLHVSDSYFSIRNIIPSSSY